jgi:hypothetical protein
MIVNPVMMPLGVVGAAGSVPQVQGAFGEALEKASDPTGYAKRQKEAEDAAAGVVSNALILPVLKQIRRSAWGQDGPFSPGIGEKTFGPEFDMQIADRIARSPRLGVTQSLTQKLMKRSSGGKAAKLDVRG